LLEDYHLMYKSPSMFSFPPSTQVNCPSCKFQAFDATRPTCHGHAFLIVYATLDASLVKPLVLDPVFDSFADSGARDSVEDYKIKMPPEDADVNLSIMCDHIGIPKVNIAQADPARSTTERFYEAAEDFALGQFDKDEPLRSDVYLGLKIN
jgi:hypothetical protein